MSKRFLSRREMLQATGGGIASLAFSHLVSARTLIRSAARRRRPPHFPGKAKAVISIFCYGGVSQVDTFDPKPLLQRAARRGADGQR